MKVSDIIRPVIAAQLEGKPILAFKEIQKEQTTNNTKNVNSFEQEAQNRIDLLV